MQNWIFSIITPVFSVTWSFRNHSTMLIWLLKKEHYFYKQLFEIEIFCIIFDQFYASLLNKVVFFTPTDPNLFNGSVYLL